MQPGSCRSSGIGPGLAEGRLARMFLVRDDERATVAYLFGLFALLGCGLAFGRGTTDALFFKRYGIEYLPPLYVLLSVLLGLVGAVYAAFVDRVSAERFFRVLFLVVALLLVLCWATMRFSALGLVYPIYFLVYEVTSELILVHAAVYLARNLDTLQAKRLSPLIFAGLQVGMLVGGLALAALARSLGAQTILLLWGLLLLLGVGMMGSWHRRRGCSPYFSAPRRSLHPLRESLRQIAEGVRFTRESALLRSAAAALFFMVVMVYVLCYSVNLVYAARYEDEAELTAFFGLLLAAGSGSSLILQVFVSNRMIDRFGVRGVNLVFPVTSLLVYLGLMARFAFPTALLGSLNKDVIMAAFRNPVYAIFFNILPQYLQGRARAMAVVVVMPSALLVCGGILSLSQAADEPLYVLLPGAVAAILFLYYSLRMNAAYVTTLVEHLRDRVWLPSGLPPARLRGSGEAVFQTLVRGVGQRDAPLALSYARTLVEGFPRRAPEVLLARALRAEAPLADRLLGLLAPLAPERAGAFLRRRTRGFDAHLRASCLTVLFRARDPGFRGAVAETLASANPRLVACGIRGVLYYPVPALREPALRAWRGLLSGPDSGRLAGLELVAELERLPPARSAGLRETYREVVARLVRSTDPAVVRRALVLCAERWPDPFPPALYPLLAKLAGDADPAMRETAVRAARLLPPERRGDLFAEALEDGHRAVRRAAVEGLWAERSGFAVEAVAWLTDRGRGSPRARRTLLEALLEQGLPVPVLERIVARATADALRLQAAWRVLAACGEVEDPGLALLRMTLAERVAQTVDVALLALQPLVADGVVATLRAGVASGDSRHVANACEGLRNLEPHSARTLAEIVQGDATGAAGGAGGGVIDTVEAVRRWSAQRADDWLHACAQRALESPAGACE